VIQAYGLSDVGCVRTSNQDRILIDEQLGLFLVADGMGGHGHGEDAAELAIRSGQYYIGASRDRFDVSWPFGYDLNRSMDENRLMTAIQLANRQVWKRAEESPECAGMGTTLVAVIVNNDRAAIGSVGDSRAYLLRAGELTQLTTDDTWVGNLIRSGALSETQAKTHSMRHVLTQAIGSHDMVDVHTCEHVFADGDLLLLTTDGIHGVVEHSAMRSILYAGRTVEETAQQLVQAARANGAPDNASCILVKYTSGAGSSQ
jgi:serine/threonine protein phosphatase PrpC